jgi:hypothetical protein
MMDTISEARVRAYCTAAGLTRLATIRDEGVSAAKPLATRPGGVALLRALARTGGSSTKRLKSSPFFHKSLILFCKKLSVPDHVTGRCVGPKDHVWEGYSAVLRPSRRYCQINGF